MVATRGVFGGLLRRKPAGLANTVPAT